MILIVIRPWSSLFKCVCVVINSQLCDANNSPESQYFGKKKGRFLPFDAVDAHGCGNMPESMGIGI